MRVVCAWCKKEMTNEKSPTTDEELISHSICNKCLTEAMAEVENYPDNHENAKTQTLISNLERTMTLCDDTLDDFDKDPFMADLDDVDDDFSEICEDRLIPESDEMDDASPAQSADERDAFTWKDVIMLGGAMGWAYEEGFRDALHKKKSD